mmetsp:Transcript_10677/g.21606  ORF Transcript_10677/g.21606 Transcript_10677/m.21606 type:complete len:105 (+) Transcript_10677:126-440(+)
MPVAMVRVLPQHVALIKLSASIGNVRAPGIVPGSIKVNSASRHGRLDIAIFSIIGDGGTCTGEQRASEYECVDSSITMMHIKEKTDHGGGGGKTSLCHVEERVL